MTSPITERELRSSMRTELQRRIASCEGQLFEEFQIERGAARADLTLVGDELEAFELKSDLDDFSRLHNQIHAYNRVFDRITIVTGAVYAGAVLNVVPSWWGVVSAERISGEDDAAPEVRLSVIRAAERNPLQDRRSLASLLWRDAAIDVLREESSITPPRKANRYALEQALAESVGIDRLRARVCQHLLNRSVAKVPSPSKQGGGSSRLDASCSAFHSLT